MESRTILLSGVGSSAEARLRTSFQDADFFVLPTARPYRETARELAAVAAIVNLDGDDDRSFRLVRELGEGGVRVLVLGPAKDPELILRAMREGAKEFLLADDQDGLTRALRAQLKPLTSDDGGRVYAVFGAKGGVGATTLAANLAGAVQRLGERTCLVDLNLNMGDVLAFLDLPGGYSISDVIANMRRLDRALLDSTLLQHASGVHVLAQTHRVEEADRVEPALLVSVIGFLRRHFGAVVLDGLRGFDEISLSALDASDRILLVVTQEVPAVRDAKRCVDLVRRLGAAEKLKVVVNRFQKNVEITTAVIEETIGLPVTATIPNDYAAVIRAVNKGEMLSEAAPKSAATKGIAQLADTLGHVRAAPPAEEKPSLLGKFFNARASHAT